MLVENFEETSIKGQRLMYDNMASKNVTIHEVIIPKELTLSCKSAYSKYKAAMESARAKTVSESREKKRKILVDEIATVKRSKGADAPSLECENKQDPIEKVNLVTKPNSLRKTAIVKREGYFRIERSNNKVGK